MRPCRHVSLEHGDNEANAKATPTYSRPNLNAGLELLTWFLIGPWRRCFSSGNKPVNAG